MTNKNSEIKESFFLRKVERRYCPRCKLSYKHIHIDTTCSTCSIAAGREVNIGLKTFYERFNSERIILIVIAVILSGGIVLVIYLLAKIFFGIEISTTLFSTTLFDPEDKENLPPQEFFSKKEFLDELWSFAGIVLGIVLLALSFAIISLLVGALK